MEQTIPRCVNHPDTETRVSCSSCDDPICTRCMRHAAVGQKCPRCAKVPRSARGIGKPKHYVRGIAAGLAAAIAGGFAASLFLGRIPFIGFFIPLLLGYAVGRAVSWGVERQTTTPFATMAAVLGGLAALVAYSFTLFDPFALLGIAIAAYFARQSLLR